MSDQPQQNKFTVQITFPYVEGNIPTYSNTVQVSPSPEGVFIDFGFFDPYFGRKLQTEWAEELSREKQIEDKSIEVQVVGRFVINRAAAEDLVRQIQETLNDIKQ